MTRIVLQHIAGFLVVCFLLFAVVTAVRSNREAAEAEAVRLIQPYLDLSSIDLGDPFQRALFLESLRAFYPDQQSRNDSLEALLQSYVLRTFTDPASRTARRESGLTADTINPLLGMYVRFVGIFAIVMFLTLTVGRMAAIQKFMQMKQGTHSFLIRLRHLYRQWKSGNAGPKVLRRFFVLAFMASAKGILSLLLFSPAYVLAYAFKTELDTGSALFMVILAVGSNGLLADVSNKFYTFLLHESEKGYVETARVKGLAEAYMLPGWLKGRLRALLTPLRYYSGHIFRHVYMNASFQYIPVVKEHAAFLITGLIIIEMALNIQGNFSYELLQRLLAGEIDVAAAIVIGIFFVVKATELLIDIWYHLRVRRFRNAAEFQGISS